jgi:hypothetical protein
MLTIVKMPPESVRRHYLRAMSFAGSETAAEPAGRWMGRGLPLLNLSGDVTKPELDLLFGQGLHPHPEHLAQGDVGTTRIRLGRAYTTATANRGPVAGWDQVFRPSPTVTDLWALGDAHTRQTIEDSHLHAIGDALAWMEDHAVFVCYGSGGAIRAKTASGLVTARFRHWANTHHMPLLHDRLLISVKTLRPDGRWGHVDSTTLLENTVVAGCLYTQRILEEVCQRLGLATEPRTVTPGLRPVIEIAGIPPEIIAWSSTRSHDIRTRLEQMEADYFADHGRPPTTRTRTKMMNMAAQETGTPRPTATPLEQLLQDWRAGAAAAVGAPLIDGLLASCRDAAATIRASAPAGIDTATAAAAITATVHRHHGIFRHRHLLAEARRHLTRELHGRRARDGLAEHIVEAALRTHCKDITPPTAPGRLPCPPDRLVYTVI